MGGKGGGGGGGVTDEQRELVALQTDLARRLFEQQQPFRDAALGAGGNEGILRNVMRTGEIPQGIQPQITAARDATEQQFANARESILSRTPSRGGQLNQLLAGTDVARAQAVGQLESGQEQAENLIRQQLFSTGLGIGVGTDPSALAGAAGTGAAQISAIEQQRAAASGRSAGAFGTLGGTAGGALSAQFLGGALGSAAGPLGTVAGTLIGGALGSKK